MNPARKTVLQATETLVARVEDQARIGFNHNPKKQTKVRTKEKEASDPTQTELKIGNNTHE
jgi:hypothetical protein